MSSTVGPLTRTEAEALYPEATLLLDVQAPHIAERDDVEFWSVVNKGNRAGVRKLHARTSDRNVRVYYDERVGIWVRYSCGFRSKPYRAGTVTTTSSLDQIVWSEFVATLVQNGDW